MNNIPIRAKKCIHSVDIHENDSVMTYNRNAPYFSNTLKKFYHSTTIFNESTSIYYDDNNEGFGLSFRKYTYNSANKVDYRALIK